MSINSNNILPLSQGSVLQPGQRVVKIGDYYFPVGLGDYYNSSAMNFYKCVSVNTQLQTWTGYKAIFQGSYYYFEETITEDLIYLGNTVQVGCIYNSNGLIKIAELFDGLLEDKQSDALILVTPETAVVNEESTLQLEDGSVDNGVLSLN